MTTNVDRSYWAASLPDGERAVGPPLDGDVEVDVAIVGAGFTGLWTAWHLKQRDPGLRVAVLERESIGFGASGRNGGWCSALLPMTLPAIAKRHGDAAATRMQHAMHATVDDIGAFVSAQGDPAVFHRGGTVETARSEQQAEQLRDHIDSYPRFGFGADDYRWLDAAEARAMMNATEVAGGTYTPHCATVHPLRLAQTIASAVIGAGVAVHEHTEVTGIDRGCVSTERGTVRAEIVVRATEGYTGDLPGERRTMIPFYSSMIATEPLSDEIWSEIGLDDRPTFNDGRRMVIYGQRTADGRIAFGGRGSPYPFASRITANREMNDTIEANLIRILRELFPVLGDTTVTHRWGGVLGVPRDWTCSVQLDRTAKFATAGGYVGDGVSTTHLAGRTLAALITDSTDDGDRDLVALPWVGHRSRRWEPEPLRWIGVNGGRSLAGKADLLEGRAGGLGKLLGKALDRLVGH